MNPAVLGAATILAVASGCAADYFISGKHMGELPASESNFNAILFGARGGGRSTNWSPLHDYEELQYENGTEE